MPRSSRPVLLVVTAVVAGLLAAVTGTPAASVAATVPTTPGAFVGVTPARVLDTRIGEGAPAAPVAGRPVHVTVAGQGGVPEGATAVVLTLTVVGKNAGGYLTAYPTGTAAPTASVVNWATGQTVAGQATVTLGTGGAVDLLVKAGKPVDLIVDVSGYFLGGAVRAAGAYVARTPTRLLDTRTGNGRPAGRLAKNDTATVQIAERGGLPDATGVSAVVGTLTAVNSATSGYLTVWGGGDRPTVSSLNFAAGQVVANQVEVPLDADGRMRVFAGGGPVDVVLDVTGFVIGGTATEAGTFVPIRPGRAFDSRVTGGLPTNTANVLALPGRAGVPATGVAAVVANLTVTNVDGVGYLTAYPSGVDRPLASNLNWTPGRTVANQASLTLGDGSAVSLYLAATRGVSVIVDVSGYYLPALLATPTGLTATPTTDSVQLHWSESDPIDDPANFYVRRAVGSVPPATPQDGTTVPTGIVGQYGVTDTGLTPATTYSYAVFAHDNTGVNYGPPATVTVTTLPPDVTPPGPDTGLTATPGVTTATLHWTPPADADYGRSVVRWQVGTTPPASPTDGTGDGVTGTDTAFVAGLASGTVYSFTVFARDVAGNVNPAGPSVTITTIGTADVTGTTFPLPAGRLDPQKGALGSDCPAVGHCVALAWNYDETAERHGEVLLSVVGDTGVTSYPVPLPSTVGSFVHPYADVSCTSDTDCVIVGDYTDDAGHPVAFTGRWNGRVATTSPYPDAAVSLSAVDCPVAGTCYAVGARSDGSGTVHPWVGRLSGGTWTGVPVIDALAPAGQGLTTVTCASTTVCAAAGGRPADRAALAVASTTTGTSWTATTAALPTGGTGWTQYYPFTCDAGGTCSTGGRYVIPGSPERYGPALVTVRSGTWTTEVLPGTPSTFDSDVVQPVCVAGQCSVLVGNGSGSTLLRRPLAGGSWTSTSMSTLPSGARTDTSQGLNGLACTSAGRCTASGSWTDSSGFARGFVSAFSSTQNSATSVTPSVAAALGGTTLGAPVCTDDGHCIDTSSYIANTENAWIASWRIVGG